VLDLKTGVLTRSFTWELGDGREVQLTFVRWVSMATPELGCQRIIAQANFDGKLEVDFSNDYAVLHMNTGGMAYWKLLRAEASGDAATTLGQTKQTGQYALTAMRIEGAEGRWEKTDTTCTLKSSIPLSKSQDTQITRYIATVVIKQSDKSEDELWNKHAPQARALTDIPYDEALRDSIAYWTNVWREQDIEIDGDPEQQQGVRFCIFQLHQTYHGIHPSHNVGAKGLTGEAYHGNTFWDTETYCLPFYLFNNPTAARTLLEYRYRTLPQAMDWARQQDAQGAFYPMATIDGTEGCGVWWHGNLEIHVSAAVAYGIWHYDRICGDKDFLYGKGVEMCIQIARFFASRGNWGPDGSYGYYGVMGPDEFHTFVNNNCYTNVMAVKCFEWTLSYLEAMEKDRADDYKALIARVELTPEECEDWRAKAKAMKIPYDPATGLFEQHDGYFDLPHLDIHSIPISDFPLYHHWSLPRIYRYDMIKQPDAMLLMLFFGSEYTLEQKRANYLYYEPRCIHESSLSPSVHSILAAELGLHKEAYEFSHYATRLDLDNYNRNSGEGLHTTSIAAAWMNIVFGYGGLRTDGPALTFRPSCPAAWKSFAFRLRYRGSLLEVCSTGEQASFRVVEGQPLTIKIYDAIYTIESDPVMVTHVGSAVQ